MKQVTHALWQITRRADGVAVTGTGRAHRERSVIARRSSYQYLWRVLWRGT
jgi:hypothetical protein